MGQWILPAARQRLPGIIVLAAVLVLQYADPWPLNGLRHQLFDLYQIFHPRPSQPLPVRVVDIDDAALSDHGQWPWPRALMARLLDRLGRAGAAVIVLDMVFSEPDRFSAETLRALLPSSLVAAELPDFDRQLAEVIGRYPVVGGVALGDRPGHGELRVKSGFALLGESPLPYLPAFPGALVNIPVLTDAFSGIGSFSVKLDRDGTVRRLPLLQVYQEQLVPALVLEALRVAQGAGTLVIRSGGSKDPPSGVRLIRVGGLDIPVSADGQMWLHFSREPAGTRISATRVLAREPGLDPQFAGRIVLVGSSAQALGDFVNTPRSVSEPALLVQAQAIAQLLQGWYLQRPSWGLTTEWLALLLTGMAVVVLTPILGVARSGLLMVVVVVLGMAAAWQAFAGQRLLLDPAVPSAGLLLVYLTTSVSVFVRSERERAKIRRAFGQYLSPDLVQQLTEDPGRLRLGGESRELSFLFSDIAGFTALTERTAAADLVRLLNAYLDGACRVVMAHGGTIDKIVGDAIHAIFGAPLEQPDHAERAVHCALALDEFACAFSAERAREGIEFGSTRIGVNTGTAVVGNFGGERRFDYTAHGDAINTAARLESANKALGTRICVARSSVEQCPRVRFRPVAALGLRGKTRLVEVFEPVVAEMTGIAPLRDYLAAYALLQGGQPEAGPAMARLAADYPGDAVVALHAARLASGDSGEQIQIA